MKMTLSFALGAVLLCFALIATPGDLQAGVIYECRDQGGNITLTDTPLGAGYNCAPRQSFQDATEEQKAALEKERAEAAEKWRQEEMAREAAEQRAKEEAEKKKQIEAAPQGYYRYW